MLQNIQIPKENMSKIARFFKKFIKKYHRLEINGIENIPIEKSAIIAPNHSGAFDWDVICLSCALDRWIHILYWDKYYYMSIWGNFIRNFKVIPLSLEKGLDENLQQLLLHEYIQKNKLIGIFPEGTSATFLEGYNIKKFYPGVVKLAIIGGIPVIPTAIVGVREAAPLLFYLTHVSIKKKRIRDIPIGIGVFPFKIKILFGAPIYLEDTELNKEKQYQISNIIREKVIELIQNLLKKK